MPPAESVARDWRERGCVFVREAMSACCAAPKARRSPIRAANLDSASGSPVQSDLLGDPAAGALATPPELRGAIDAATTAGLDRGSPQRTGGDPVRPDPAGRPADGGIWPYGNGCACAASARCGRLATGFELEFAPLPPSGLLQAATGGPALSSTTPLRPTRSIAARGQSRRQGLSKRS